MKTVKLDVPCYKNFNNYSCFVTAVAMILRYFGRRINQKNVFEKAKVYHPKDKDRIFGCTVPSIMLALKDEGYKMTAWHHRDAKGIKKAGKETELFFDIWEKQIKEAEKLGILESHKNGKFSFIKKYLNKGLPVIVGIKSKTFYKGNPFWENSIYNRKWSEDTNHVIVIIGYKDKNYIYNDSSPFLQGNKGKNMKVSEAKLKKAWKDAAYVRNAIFVLEKINKRNIYS
jgi:uncharacterized protein YvpB